MESVKQKVAKSVSKSSSKKYADVQTPRHVSASRSVNTSAAKLESVRSQSCSSAVTKVAIVADEVKRT